MKYLLMKIIYVLKGRDMDVILKFFRKYGIKVGEKCNIYSNIVTSESYLINIGNNTTISNNVQLITHDNSICKLDEKNTDLFGEINIGNNCFIGAQTIILPGVSLADNIIVGAGSVVTKSFEETNIIIAGNPAVRINSWDNLAIKIHEKKFNLTGLESVNKENLIKSNKKKYIKR